MFSGNFWVSNLVIFVVVGCASLFDVVHLHILYCKVTLMKANPQNTNHILVKIKRIIYNSSNTSPSNLYLCRVIALTCITKTVQMLPVHPSTWGLVGMCKALIGYWGVLIKDFDLSDFLAGQRLIGEFKRAHVAFLLLQCRSLYIK